jgi:oligosaccharide amylase
MAKSLVLGNGSVLVGLDMRAQIKDLYFDYVGLENHLTEEAVCKVGIWVDEQISWLDDLSWEITIDYRKETLASKIEAINENLKIKLTFLDLVYNEKNIVIRNITVHNLENRKREIRLFLNHQFRMYGVTKKDTVYYDPADKTIVHYKGRRLALIGGQLGKEPFSDYTVGLSYIGEHVGTWLDAEDGLLSKNAIEHGTVDSTVAFEKVADADKSFTVNYWICLGKTLEEVKDLHYYISKKTPEHLTETTGDFWHAWLNKTKMDFNGLDERVIDLYKKSLLIIRTHVDNTGGILASGDSNMLQYGKDNYTYIWHRDGAFVAEALDAAGYHEVARKFFEFSNETITEQGYFFHKYRPDKSLGSSWHGFITPDGKHRLPIQEDETALVISALWKHYEKTKDIEFVESVYNSLIKKAAEFMAGFRNANGLPSATYDLWERTWGVHTFTAASVYDGLLAAARFAELLGKEENQERYSKAADELKKAILENLYNEKANYFYKSVDYEEGAALHDETIDISSFYGVFQFNVLPPDDPKMESAFETVKDKLFVKTELGGVARFEGDTYYQVDKNVPGNPWIVTTLWVAQYYIKKASTKGELKEAEDLINWAVARAWTSGVMSEQVDPHSGLGLSATPLTWSHAEFVTTVILYLEKLKELKL